MSDWCAVEPELAIVYYHYILPAEFGVAFLSTLPIIYLYLKAHINKKLRVTRINFGIGLLFFITVATTFLSWTIQQSAFCRNNIQLFLVFLNFGSQMYSIQTIMLIGIFYYRLYSIFSNTPMALSVSLTACFTVYYVLMSLFLIFGLALWANYFSDSSLMIALAGLLVVAAIIFLQALFCYKLYCVHHSAGNRTNGGQGMKRVIVKNTLLAVISTSVTLLTFIMIALDPMVNSVHFMLFRANCAGFDVYTNYVCLALSYKYFDGYYWKLCGCCDGTCHRLWSKSLKRKETTGEPVAMEPVVSDEASGHTVNSPSSAEL